MIPFNFIHFFYQFGRSQGYPAFSMDHGMAVCTYHCQVLFRIRFPYCSVTEGLKVMDVNITVAPVSVSFLKIKPADLTPKPQYLLCLSWKLTAPFCLHGMDDFHPAFGAAFLEMDSLLLLKIGLDRL